MLDTTKAKEAAAAPDAAGTPTLGPLFAYIWRNSRQQQLVILLVVLASLPFYYYSLELPKSIVNDAIQGRAFSHGNTTATLFAFRMTLPGWLGGELAFPGFALDRYGYLFVLSGVFMVLVLVNGVFRYIVNMQKGKLGERLLRRLRLDLFTLLLMFTPEAMRNVKPSEVATIIKDEVEPIGGFVGDAFVQPAFLGGQALTALAFILVQSPSLGIIAGAIVLAQGLIIPRLRREQLRLGRERQIRSRHLAGHIGEIVDGMAEVENHGTSTYERYKVARLLDQLFWIRYDLYGRKFMVKFINSVLAQVTPFLFYSIGGYYALRGSLDIGQLVAVIAAYRDLPPPIKELIDWDQQRLDVAVKYQQIVEQFAAASDEQGVAVHLPTDLTGAVEVQGLKVKAASGEPLLEGVSTVLPLGSHTALLALSGEGADALAKVIGRRITAYEGTVRIAGRDLSVVSEAEIGLRMAYFGRESALFQGTIRDNVLYSLKRPAASIGSVRRDIDAIARPGKGEAVVGDGSASWLDYAAAGAEGPDDIDEAVIAVLDVAGMSETVYRLGLGRRLDTQRELAVADRIVQMRGDLNKALEEENASGLIEPLDPERFNRNATLGENLLFGVLREGGVSEDSLFADVEVRKVLESEGLTQDLADVGLNIAATMVELFSDLSSDHFLFERFSFIAADELGDFKEIVARSVAGSALALTAGDKSRLMLLALAYSEPRHRLGLVGDDLAERVVRARLALRSRLPTALAAAVEFYDPSRYCAAAPLRDNLLFGRIDQTVAGSTERVLATLHRLLHESGLEKEVYRIGLDFGIGPGGRLLAPVQRGAVALARCLLKRPSILVIDDPLAIFGEIEGRAVIERVRQRLAGQTVIVALRDQDAAQTFDVVLSFAGGRLRQAAPDAEQESGGSAGQQEHAEIEALRAVPMFSTVDSTRLKLIAFTSDRVSFAPNQMLFHQDDPSDSAYVLLDGEADVFLETNAGPLHLTAIGPHSIVGEMGVVTGAGRSATVVARSEVHAIRLSRDVVLGLIGEFPQIALAMLRDQIRRTVHADARLAKISASVRSET